ncbi:hypothetical protein [Sphaerisporangium aureirubrum]|uniref:Uncharacterized protein n=1 Tax=Sphaerisporangium aureirubrum TaxID=1544736 RepID=A0ABW1NDS1_9ACTN
MTPAQLYSLARAVSGTGPATLTFVTHDDGKHHYAAWPYGCVHVPTPIYARLGHPRDGTHQILARGALQPVEIPRYDPDFVRRVMLPHLDQADRVPVAESVWVRQLSATVYHRLIRRLDGHYFEVDEKLFQAWSQVASGPLWQLAGGVRKPLVWASSEVAAQRERATALLMPIHTLEEPKPPSLDEIGPEPEPAERRAVT